MGVTGLNNYLKKYPAVVTQCHLSHFAFKRIAFDISSYIYRYMATYGKVDNKWINAFIYLMCVFRENAVHMIPIFDGKPPPEKMEESADRSVQRGKITDKSSKLSDAIAEYKESGNVDEILVYTMKHLEMKNRKTSPVSKSLLRPDKNDAEVSDDIKIDIAALEDYLDSRERSQFSIDNDDIELLQQMFTLMKIPYINAPEEAESLANYLVKSGQADITFSLDSDCVAYQVPIIIKDIDTRTGICQVIRMDTLCEELDMTPDQVTLMCIIMSCDYNRHTKKVKGVGPVNAAKMVKKWGTYEEIKNNEKAFQIEDDGLRYYRCAELFNPDYPQFAGVSMVWDIDIDFEELEKFLRTHKLNSDMNKIKRLWTPPEIVFE